MSNFADSLYRSIIVNKTVKNQYGHSNGHSMGIHRKKQNVLDGHSMGIQITRFFFLSFDI